MYCISCGEKQPANSLFCPKCGVAQKATSESVNTSLPAELVSSEEPINQATQDVMEPRDEALHEFIGPNDDYYFYKWGLRDGGEIKKHSWNWAAFFLSTFWLGYRKMYLPVFVLLIIFLIIDAVMYAADLSDSLDYAVGLGIWIATGMFGNYLYFIHASKKIEKLRQNGNYDLDSIRRAGGRSVLGVFMALGMVMIYAIITTFILAPALTTEKIEFGKGVVSGEIVMPASRFSTDDEIFYTFYFPDYKGGKYKIIIEKVEEDFVTIYDQWEDEVPPDWEGLYNSMLAPAEPGEYMMKVVKNGKVAVKGTFSIN